jgi:hypothetical protein
MGDRRYVLSFWFAALGTLCAGCGRQDTECLGSIGRKLTDRALAATARFREKIDSVKWFRGGSDNIQERVSLRLRWEKLLADTNIEVVATGKEIELKGNVKTAEQRTRAIELAEATAGVERVLVSLTMDLE